MVLAKLSWSGNGHPMTVLSYRRKNLILFFDGPENERYMHRSREDHLLRNQQYFNAILQKSFLS